MRPETDRVLALAGVFQAALLTQQAAREGRPQSAAATASLERVVESSRQGLANPRLCAGRSTPGAARAGKRMPAQ